MENPPGVDGDRGPVPGVQGRPKPPPQSSENSTANKAPASADQHGLSVEVARAKIALADAKKRRRTVEIRLDPAQAKFDDILLTVARTRTFRFPTTLCLIVGLGLLEVVAAETAAEALLLSNYFTILVTVAFVAIVVGGAILASFITGARQYFILVFQIVLTGILFVLRYQYFLHFMPASNSILTGVTLTAITLAVYIFTEVLAKRIEPYQLWRARAQVDSLKSDLADCDETIAECEVAVDQADEAQKLRERRPRRSDTK
jgi:hypothetical protein